MYQPQKGYTGVTGFGFVMSPIPLEEFSLTAESREKIGRKEIRTGEVVEVRANANTSPQTYGIYHKGVYICDLGTVFHKESIDILLTEPPLPPINNKLYDKDTHKKLLEIYFNGLKEYTREHEDCEVVTGNKQNLIFTNTYLRNLISRGYIPTSIIEGWRNDVITCIHHTSGTDINLFLNIYPTLAKKGYFGEAVMSNEN